MKTFKSNKGITLIALVITIIVLLILAGVTINVLLGENGVITKTTQAKEKQDAAELNEKILLAVQTYEIDRKTGKTVSLEDKLAAELDATKIEEVTENGKVAVLSYDGQDLKIDLEKGTITEDTEFDLWDGQSASTGLVGKGTAEEPYLIRSANDLNYMGLTIGAEGNITGLNADGTANGVNERASTSKYKLMTNIALNNVENYDQWDDVGFDKTTLNDWTPIGRNGIETANGKTFFGEFDGNGYEVTGPYVETTDGWSLGLFGYIGSGFSNTYTAIIKNLRVTNAYITGHSDVGAIAGGSNSPAIIENCYASGNVQCVENSDGWFGSCAGGILGELAGGRISSCISEVNLDGDIYVGGITGKIYSSTYNKINVVVENCYNKGLVRGYQEIGGIVGTGSGDANYLGQINNCSNEGTISGNHTHTYYFGGIIGRAGNININNCYNEGNLTNLIPLEPGKGMNCMGGIVGHYYLNGSTHLQISNSYNTGSIEGNVNYAGGIIGALTCPNDATATITLVNCNNQKAITSTNEYVDNLVGNMSDRVIIK